MSGKDRKVSLSQLQARILAIVILVLSLALVAIGSYAIYLRLTLKEYELRIVELRTNRTVPSVPPSGGEVVPTATVSRGREMSIGTATETREAMEIAEVTEATGTVEVGVTSTEASISKAETSATAIAAKLFEVEIPSFDLLISNMRPLLDASESFSVTLEPSPDVVYDALSASPDYLIDEASSDLFILVKIGSPTPTTVSTENTETGSFYSVQLLAYYSAKAALERSLLLRSNGFPSFVYSYFSSSGRKWYAVELGVYPDLRSALKASRELPEGFIGEIIGHDISDRFVRRIRAPSH